MASVKWIKITTDIFDDEKIILIESLPESYAIITVWFKLLCLAGKQNNCGVFMMGRIPYTDKMLATIFRMKEATVSLALQTFEQFGMIEMIDGAITIPHWEKHQSLDKLEVAKEQTRQRVARHREKQKQLLAESNGECNAECNVTGNVTVTQSNADRIRNIDIDITIEKEKDKREKENVTDESPSDSATPQQIVELYNSICKSFPSVRTLSEARKKTLRARLKTYTLDDFKELFERAEASSFLKGGNNRNWVATFDWLIKDANMAKVLDGNFDNRQGNSSFNSDEFFNAALNKSYGRGALEREAAERMEQKEEPKTVADDPELLDRLKKLVGVE